MRIRKAASSSEASTDLAIYAEGVRLMRMPSKADSKDVLGWEYQSRMHGNPGATPDRAPRVSATPEN